MARNMDDIITEIYNDLHRQAVNKSLKEKDIAQAKYEGYEQALCDFTREFDGKLEEEQPNDRSN